MFVGYVIANGITAQQLFGAGSGGGFYRPGNSGRLFYGDYNRRKTAIMLNRITENGRFDGIVCTLMKLVQFIYGVGSCVDLFTQKPLL